MEQTMPLTVSQKVSQAVTVFVSFGIIGYSVTTVLLTILSVFERIW